jgi:hypothetical protein
MVTLLFGAKAGEKCPALVARLTIRSVGLRAFILTFASNDGAIRSFAIPGPR